MRKQPQPEKEKSSNLPGKNYSDVFSVYLVFKEELNLMLKVLRLLVKVWWVELGGTDFLLTNT